MLTPDLVTDRTIVSGAGVDTVLVNHDLLLGVQFDVYCPSQSLIFPTWRSVTLNVHLIMHSM